MSALVEPLAFSISNLATVAGVLLGFWALAYLIATQAPKALMWLQQYRERRAATHRVLELDDRELHAVHRAIAFAVALGRLPDDTYVVQVRACPEHGRDLFVSPADFAGFNSLADLPKEWSAS